MLIDLSTYFPLSNKLVLSTTIPKKKLTKPFPYIMIMSSMVQSYASCQEITPPMAVLQQLATLCLMESGI